MTPNIVDDDNTLARASALLEIDEDLRIELVGPVIR